MQFDDGTLGAVEPAADAFDRAMTEACAYSEGARTILILDQLQAADFADHIRLYHFATTREWAGVAGGVRANPKNLLLVLISEQALYHSLAKVSYRLWTDAQHAYLDYRPEDHGLGPDAQALFAALAAVFRAAHYPDAARIRAPAARSAASRAQRRPVAPIPVRLIEARNGRACTRSELSAPLRAALDALAAYLGHDEVQL